MNRLSHTTAILLGIILGSIFAEIMVNLLFETKVNCKVEGLPEQMEVIYIPNSSFDYTKHKLFIDSKEMIK